jgi:hypothetical protein
MGVRENLRIIHRRAGMGVRLDCEVICICATVRVDRSSRNAHAVTGVIVVPRYPIRLTVAEMRMRMSSDYAFTRTAVCVVHYRRDYCSLRGIRGIRGGDMRMRGHMGNLGARVRMDGNVKRPLNAGMAMHLNEVQRAKVAVRMPALVRRHLRRVVNQMGIK